MSSNIIGLFAKKLDTQNEKVKTASAPLPKKSDEPSEKVKKASWNLDIIKKELVTTIDTVYKEGNNDTVGLTNLNKR